MPCTEAYREHIMYMFNGYWKTVMRFAAINAWHDRSRRRQKEISLEYLTEEKFYPLGTTDEYKILACGTKGIEGSPHRGNRHFLRARFYHSTKFRLSAHFVLRESCWGCHPKPAFLRLRRLKKSPDGHNHSGNIHVHIVINSLRIAEVPLLPYMERPADTREGCKHRCTDAAMEYFKAEVMEMCHRENLYQIDLLNDSKN